jgi:hypothetical protein
LIKFDKVDEAADVIQNYLSKSEHKSNKDLLKLNLKLKIDKTDLKNETELFDTFYKSIKVIKEKVRVLDLIKSILGLTRFINPLFLF